MKTVRVDKFTKGTVVESGKVRQVLVGEGEVLSGTTVTRPITVTCGFLNIGDGRQ